MTFQLVPLRKTEISKDWTQQELAEFYRVESVLGASGIRVDTERGLSDEGDPWFAFCHPETHDVIIHFARFDGFYIAASQAFGCALRGRSFRDLIDAFIAKQPLSVPNLQDRSDIVVLHPSAFLSALVATALLLLSHQDADAASLASRDWDLNADRGSGTNDRFAKFVFSLVETFVPQDQRLALMAMGAIVAGLTAVAYETTRDNPIVLLPTETEAVDTTGAPNEVGSVENKENDFQVASLKADDAPVVTPCDSSTTSCVTFLDLEISPDLFNFALIDPKIMVNTLFSNLDIYSIQPSSLPYDAGMVFLPDFDAVRLNTGSESLQSKPHKETEAAAKAEANGTDKADAEIGLHVARNDALDHANQESLATVAAKNFEIHISMMNLMTGPELSSFDLQAFLALPSPTGALDLSGNTFDIVAIVDEKVSSDQNPAVAIKDFTNKNPDFKFAKIGRDVVFFDFEERINHKYKVDIHSWLFSDGSKIAIIGSIPLQADDA